MERQDAPVLPASSVTFHCIVGGTRAVRLAAADSLAGSLPRLPLPVPPAQWPFLRDILPARAPAEAGAIVIDDLHYAFPSGQTPGTRLVLTQSTYQLQRWIDWLDRHPHVIVVAHAERQALTHGAPDAFAQRGPWHRITVHDVTDGDGDSGPIDTEAAPLRAAFTLNAADRRALFIQASAADRDENPALQLAVASACMELNELQPAQDALEHALALAPDWEAVFFEYGKLWLRADDLTRAAHYFSEAASRMPTFSAALSNLGASLAETDQPDAAIAALEQALRSDPAGHPILNNLAVIYRESGRLDDAITAGHRVLALAPGFVFGYYNMAHALFLQGRFAEARDMYAAGHDRDPQRNPVQWSRLAVARIAAGDERQALEDLHAILTRVPDDLRATIAAEVDATLEALCSVPSLDASALERVRQHVKTLSGTA